MSLFKCENCGCVENTALSRYWFKGNGPALCSACDPEIGKWHNRFPRVDADAEGYQPTEIGGRFIEQPK